MRVHAQELEPHPANEGDTEGGNRWDDGEMSIEASSSNERLVEGADHGDSSPSEDPQSANQQVDMETDGQLPEGRGSGDTTTAASAETAATGAFNNGGWGGSMQVIENS